MSEDGVKVDWGRSVSELKVLGCSSVRLSFSVQSTDSFNLTQLSSITFDSIHKLFYSSFSFLSFDANHTTGCWLYIDHAGTTPFTMSFQ